MLDWVQGALKHPCGNQGRFFARSWTQHGRGCRHNSGAPGHGWRSQQTLVKDLSIATSTEGASRAGDMYSRGLPAQGVGTMVARSRGGCPRLRLLCFWPSGHLGGTGVSVGPPGHLGGTTGVWLRASGMLICPYRGQGDNPNGTVTWGTVFMCKDLRVLRHDAQRLA